MAARTSLPILLTLLAGVAACDRDSPLNPTTGPDAHVAAQSGDRAPDLPAEATTTLHWFADGTEVEGARARLLRSYDALGIRTRTAGLPHRHVMTLWWVIFNHPEHCQHGEGEAACGEGDLFDAPEVEPSCPFADGSIVGGNGGARFQDRLPLGETRDSCIDFFVDEFGLEGEDHGLTNPEGAEVHVIVRSHGPLLPGQVPEQRGTFAGGCEEFLAPGADPELDPGQCSDLQFGVFSPDD